MWKPVRSPILPVPPAIRRDYRRLAGPGRGVAGCAEGRGFPYAFFYLIAVFAVAWYGGYVPGAIACLLTTVAFRSP